MNKPKTVDEYIKSTPREFHGRLNELRKAIKSVVPGALEKISYGMPFYSYKGRVVYFSLWKDHVGVYAITSDITDKFKKEVDKYKVHKGTLHFPNGKKLPIALIKKLVKAQVKLNESKSSSKK